MNKLLIVLLLVSSNSFAATKWVDEKGQTHYTDQLPPTHARAKDLKEVKEITPPVAASGVSDSKPSEDKKELAKSKKEAADKLAIEAKQKEVKASNCTASQQNLANLKDGMRVATVDPKTGERAYMEDDERAKKVTQYQQDVNKYCN
ncbi:MAG: DUF4124 domain-containing protein [Sideroxydans sp.]|nr:DUF4124 domain-containing protein [Sideroxydans sp.]